MSEPINHEWLRSIGIYQSDDGKKHPDDEPTEFGVRVVGGSDDGWKTSSDDDDPKDEIVELIVALEPGESWVSVWLEVYTEGTRKTVAVIELGPRRTRAEILDLCRALKAWAIKYPEARAA